jgi:hypothetical protein
LKSAPNALSATSTLLPLPCILIFMLRLPCSGI